MFELLNIFSVFLSVFALLVDVANSNSNSNKLAIALCILSALWRVLRVSSLAQQSLRFVVVAAALRRANK